LHLKQLRFQGVIARAPFSPRGVLRVITPREEEHALQLSDVRRSGRPRHPIFNNLLGINNQGLIARFYGIGAKHDPNQGFLRGRWVDVRPNWKERPTAPTKLRYD
jgi:hypothetical protein